MPYIVVQVPWKPINGWIYSGLEAKWSCDPHLSFVAKNVWGAGSDEERWMEQSLPGNHATPTRVSVLPLLEPWAHEFLLQFLYIGSLEFCREEV